MLLRYLEGAVTSLFLYPFSFPCAKRRTGISPRTSDCCPATRCPYFGNNHNNGGQTYSVRLSVAENYFVHPLRRACTNCVNQCRYREQRQGASWLLEQLPRHRRNNKEGTTMLTTNANSANRRFATPAEAVNRGRGYTDRNRNAVKSARSLALWCGLVNFVYVLSHALACLPVDAQQLTV